MRQPPTHSDTLFSNLVFVGAPLAIGWLTGRYDRARLPDAEPAFRHPALPPSWMSDPWLALGRDIVPAALFFTAFVLGIRRKYARFRPPA